ncbi:MAG TPA: serine hydrolase domain-containing protein [Thermoanaerobaculia bacterium]|jgi:CubicO group peptidase (beta-lactamase class C family)
MLKRALLVVVLFLAAIPSFGQQLYEGEIRQLEQFVEEHMRETKMPALSIAIVKDGFRWSKGFGYADLENQVPATAQSSYRMASVTKPMTAVAVMKLVEQGKIDLDAEVQTYVPFFPRKQYPVTIRQLLAHLGGISHYKNYEAEGRIREPKTTRESVAIFQDWDLVVEPGTQYRYSSYGYNLLGAVIEGASGRSYGDYMRDEVWGPLGMTDTRMDDPRAVIPNRVHGYVLEKGTLRNSEYVDISSRFAGGGTRSTVVDMLKFVEGVDAGKAVTRMTVDTMWTPQQTRDGKTISYGLGFGVVPQNGRFFVAHSGSQQETRTTFGYMPGAHFAFALATNFEDANLDVLANRLVTLFLGDTLNLAYHVPGKSQRGMLNVMDRTWNRGLAHWDRFGRTNGEDLAAAFRHFNAAVKSGDASKYPPLIAVGSAMAAELARSGADLGQYHRDAELAFFDDYIRLYKTSKTIPPAHRFDPAFETQIARWRRDWDRLWTAEVKAFSIEDVADIDVLDKAIRPRLAVSSIAPDYTEALVDLGQNASLRRDHATAMRVATTLLTLYPESDVANGFGGIAEILFGDVAKGRALIAKSRTIDATGYVNPRRLTAIAGELERAGYKEGAAELRAIK